MGATCHVASSADGAAPAEPRPSASAPWAPAASAIAETVRNGWRQLPGRAPPRSRPPPGTTSRVYPTRGPGQPCRPRSPTATKARGPPQAPTRRPHCAPVPGFRPRPRLTPPPPHLGKPGPLGVVVRCRPRAATARGWHRHRPLVPLGPHPPAADGGSRDQWFRVERCHWARATSSGVTPNALCKSRRCRFSSSSDSASTDRLEPGPVGIPPAGAPDELPTAATRGGPKGCAPSGRCPSRGEG